MPCPSWPLGSAAALTSGSCRSTHRSSLLLQPEGSTSHNRVRPCSMLSPAVSSWPQCWVRGCLSPSPLVSPSCSHLATLNISVCGHLRLACVLSRESFVALRLFKLLKLQRGESKGSSHAAIPVMPTSSILARGTTAFIGHLATWLRPCSQMPQSPLSILPTTGTLCFLEPGLSTVPAGPQLLPHMPSALVSLRFSRLFPTTRPLHVPSARVPLLPASYYLSLRSASSRKPSRNPQAC